MQTKAFSGMGGEGGCFTQYLLIFRSILHFDAVISQLFTLKKKKTRQNALLYLRKKG